MSDNALEVLLPSLGLVPFERRPDGSFASLLPPPDWFRPRTADGVFPFLGHILEEATAFWDLGATGVQARTIGGSSGADRVSGKARGPGSQAGRTQPQPFCEDRAAQAR